MADDLQIGITGESEPQCCGCGCGQEVRGRHANTYSIEGTSAYYRVLAKHVEAWDSNPANHTALVKEYKAAKKPVPVPVIEESKKGDK